MCAVFDGVGVEFDDLPKLDFPRVKPEAFETAGCRVGRGLGLGLWRLWWWWGGGGLSSVMEECGAVSVGQSIPFHTLVERKRRAGGERRAGWSWASFSDS